MHREKLVAQWPRLGHVIIYAPACPHFCVVRAYIQLRIRYVGPLGRHALVHLCVCMYVCVLCMSHILCITCCFVCLYEMSVMYVTYVRYVMYIVYMYFVYVMHVFGPCVCLSVCLPVCTYVCLYLCTYVTTT